MPALMAQCIGVNTDQVDADHKGAKNSRSIQRLCQTRVVHSKGKPYLCTTPKCIEGATFCTEAILIISDTDFDHR